MCRVETASSAEKMTRANPLGRPRRHYQSTVIVETGSIGYIQIVRHTTAFLIAWAGMRRWRRR